MKGRILKTLILLSTAYAMIRMAHWAAGFTYFTQLSNLFAAAVVLWQLIRPGEKATLWKYAATVSILVTFLVFLCVLAPRVPGGLMAAYAQDHWASLCLHLITPALTAADFLLHDALPVRWRKKHIFLSLLPPLVYYAFVLLLSWAGFRWGGMAGPYFFLDYAGPAGWLGFAPEEGRVGVAYAVLAMIGVFLLLGWGMWAAARRAGAGRSRKA